MLCAGHLVACLTAPPAGADDIVYYEDGDQVVFTNLPTSGAKPALPRELHRRSGAALPATVYDPFIEKVAAELSLDPGLIKAVALVESGFNPGAVSRKGAQGIMQLMPATARSYGVKDPHDPYENLRAGARHLRNLLDEFDGDVTLALAAYNAGSGAVRRHRGVPAYRETQDYVTKVERHLNGGRRRRPTSPTATKVKLHLEADGSVSLSN